MKTKFPPKLKPYALPITLGGIVILFALILLGEGFWVEHSLREGRQSAVKANKDALGEEIALKGVELPPIEQYPETVARPLFMETRRPSPPAPPGPPPKREPPSPVTFHLMGIVESPNGRIALIADSKGKYKRLKTTEAQEGWEVTQIGKDRLWVEQDGLGQDLPLIKKRPKTQAPSEAPTPPPAPVLTPPPAPNSPQTLHRSPHPTDTTGESMESQPIEDEPPNDDY